jgi:carboxyl-terminal processing protease
MRKWKPLRLVAVSLAILVGWVTCTVPAVPVAAQVLIPAEPQVDDTVIAGVLAEGLELERARHWSEALSHYEEAVREHPGRSDLESRLKSARIHFDLTRRYADSSFVRGLSQATEQEALDVYSEVLLKVESHYVNDPSWSQIVQRGMTQFDAALTDDVFLSKHLPQVSQQRITAFRQELYRTIHPDRVRNRHEARDVAAYTGRLAAQRLGVSPTAVLFEFICGSSGALDAYSTFLTEAQLEDVYAQIEGNFVGLGVELKADGGALLIVNTIPGSPAQQAGIRAGDRIVAVAGQSTQDISTDKAADILKGEEGSKVVVTVESTDGTARDVQVVRRRVEVPSIENAHIVDSQHGVAYLKLASFQKTTSRDVDTALWKLHREGMRSLIVDVRGNPGGLLTASVDVADKFVTSGTLVSTRGRSAREDFDYKAHQVGTWRVPLVVLIDRDTASASEIFAGAIRDHRRGEVVGETSYGKGSVQGIFPLRASKSGVRLTTAKFFGPSGRAISKNGVDPTVGVQTAAKPVANGQWVANETGPRDAVLAAGVEAARRLSTSSLSRR